MRKFIFVLILLQSIFSFSQELNCSVTVNFDKVTNANTQIFKNLERSLNDFVNKNVWTDLPVKQNERINCSFFITINTFESNGFNASIQVQASRPIYNSSYASPLININDKDFNFNYIEFENLTYNPNSFDSNLMSVIAFYCYYIIGTDADTLELNGGDNYFQMAQDIISLAAPSGYKGWSQTEQTQNRFYLINDLLSPTFNGYREAMYSYHFEGLDTMEKEPLKSKETIKSAIIKFKDVNATRPNAYLTRTFIDAKQDEIISIFSSGPSIKITDLVETLNKISPINVSKWSKIK